MPALLKIKRSIENDIWRINFSLDTVTLSEYDKELMRKFGEPQINIGGTYDSESVNAWSYTLEDKYLRIRTDLPFTQEFDSKSPDYADYTQEKALIFQSSFVAKYNDAFTAMRASSDTFTGEFLENI
jgi:hypothetical protein